ncbi:MAG: cystatin domain-containing protein [Pseudomonadota bacterium]
MKKKVIQAYVAGFILLTTTIVIGCMAQHPMPGGYSATEVTNTDVVAAATFAINAEEKAMREEKNTQTVKLELIKILSAQKQVVAGMNYRLKLKVKLNGEEKKAEAVVWWQAWRAPDPYQLTSWNWK